MFRAARWLVAFPLGVALALSGLTGARALADDPVRIRITEVDVAAFPDVRLLVSAVDGQDRPVSELTPRDFFITEDGRPQNAGVVPAAQSAPVALALALDTSGSMGGRPLADAKAAIGLLVRALGPDDSAAIVTFNTASRIAQGLTSDKAALLAATDSAAAGGNTAIFDAVAQSINLLAAIPPSSRRAIVLLTDGVDNSSAINLSTVTERLRAQGYPMYVIGLGNDLDRGVLQALADGAKGGQAFVAPSSAELAGIYAGLSQRIFTQYVVSYRSNAVSAADGAPVTVTTQILRAGTSIAAASATFTVPIGRGIVPAPPAPQSATSATAANPPPAADPARVSGPFSAELVALLAAATALTFVLWAFVVGTASSLGARQRRRVDGLSQSQDRHSAPVERRSIWRRAVVPGVVRLSRPLARVAGGFMSAPIRRRLLHAGEPLDLVSAEFLGLQLGLGIVAAVCAGAVAVVRVGPAPAWIILGALGGFLIGILAPSVALDRAGRSRKRRILRALPSALDMLALSARAGMTFDGAIAQVAQQWDGPLSTEFRRMLSEFRVGRDRRDALRDMAERTGVTEVARFANAIIQSDALGVPISKVLRDQAIEMRTRRRQRAEEAARKAPIKMLFPMVALIFPALFVVILGPAVPRLLDIFRTAI